MKNCYVLMFIVSFCISAFAQTQSIKVEAGWNLISLPRCVIDSTKSSLFPTAISDAFIFQNVYVSKDTLENGFGFWLKFDSSQTIPISGNTIVEDTIAVQTDWNMIGALTVPIAVSRIKTDPPNITDSDFFDFTNGIYQSTDTIQPGKGFWVKVKQSGVIILSSVDNPCPGIPTVDYSGKTYNTVQIGSQCWLKENLDVGTRIDGSQNQSNNSIIEKYCYNNDTNNCNVHGGLYQWNEAMQYSTTEGSQGICPIGWHLPSYIESSKLSTVVGRDGNALKAVGQGTGVGTGTNTSGFSSLLSGTRLTSGYFDYLGEGAYYWNSPEHDASNGQSMSLNFNSGTINFNHFDKVYGFSIRCIKDSVPNNPPNQPFNPSPTDNSLGIDTNTTISWSCTDPENDPLIYDIYLGTENPPMTIVSSNQTDTSLVKSNLKQGTVYYWKVVAKDNRSNSTSGPVWNFTTKEGTCAGISTVDYAGKTYNTIQIGSRCWLKENLDVGTMILDNQNASNNGTIEKYCYNNDQANCNIYGGLYQWNEAMQYTPTDGAQGICPRGWQLPTYSELQTLDTIVGGDGNALKAVGQGTGAGAGTNTSGFSALLSGGRGYNGGFGALGLNMLSWSSSVNELDHPTTRARLLVLNNYGSNIVIALFDMTSGLSIRCIKYNVPPEQPSNPRPANNQIDIDINTNLSWECTDLDNGSLSRSRLPIHL
jgi:uncharacterized protein (TIGR02145 family)